MELMHERVAGLDVHKATVAACVRIVDGGKVLRECRTFETATAGLEALLAWLTQSGCTHVAMEATGVYWKPVWNILSDGKFELILANAAHIKNLPGRKTDVNGATWIARLAAFGLIKASFVPEEKIQELRSLMRAGKQLGAGCGCRAGQRACLETCRAGPVGASRPYPARLLACVFARR
jgi:transposase